jgi:hypothetical protein
VQCVSSKTVVVHLNCGDFAVSLWKPYILATPAPCPLLCLAPRDAEFEGRIFVKIRNSAVSSMARGRDFCSSSRSARPEEEQEEVLVGLDLTTGGLECEKTADPEIKVPMGHIREREVFKTALGSTYLTVELSTPREYNWVDRFCLPVCFKFRLLPFLDNQSPLLARSYRTKPFRPLLGSNVHK